MTSTEKHPSQGWTMTKRTKEQTWELNRRIRRLASKGRTMPEIARRCDVSFATVYAVLSTPMVDRGVRAAERRVVWASLARQGIPFAEIARRSSVSSTAVRLALKRVAEASPVSEGMA